MKGEKPDIVRSKPGAVRDRLPGHAAPQSACRGTRRPAVACPTAGGRLVCPFTADDDRRGQGAPAAAGKGRDGRLARRSR